MNPQDFMARELHSRTNDGIHVRLLWSEHDGRVSVAVVDRKTGEAFSIEVGPRDRPLDVFHHPYAYARSRSSTAPAQIAAPAGMSAAS